MSWLLEGDIKSFFDSIDHHMLAGLIEKHFNEARLVHLYWKLVKAGYVEWDNKKRSFVNTDRGVPQGGIISPLLSNLVLHELDLFIDKQKKQYEESRQAVKPLRNNPKYSRLTDRIRREKKILDSIPSSHAVK